MTSVSTKIIPGPKYQKVFAEIIDPSDNSINVSWDTITPTFNATSDVYVYTLSGVTQQTITLNYTDSTKATLLSVVKS